MTAAWGDRYLLLLGAAMSLRERAVVAALREFDGPVVTVARARNSKSAKFFDEVLIGDFSDPDEVLRLVVEHEKETGRTPAGVVPFFDPGLVPGWTVADHYGLPFLSRAAVDDSSINKDRMKDRLLAAGVATPRYIRVADVASAVAAGERFGFPCVIKPCAFGGSLGVRLVSGVDEMAEAYAYVRGIIDSNAAVFTVKNREIQVEEYCTLVDEVSVEILNHRDQRVVLGVTDKIVGPRPYFAELGHRVPSVYTDREDVHDIVIRACTAIGLDRGVAHVELRLEPDVAPQIIEVGARTAGDGIIDQVERAYGVSPYALHVRSFLDRIDEPVVVPQPSGLAGISMLKAPAGRIAAIEPVSEVDPAVVAYEVTAVAGAESAAVSANYLNREGYVEVAWPGAHPQDIPIDAQTEIADSLSARLFRMA